MVRSQALTARRIADAAPAFAALGDETRLRLVSRLSARGPQSTVDLTAVADVSRQATTKHLRALEVAGLVDSRRDGRRRLWAVRERRLAEMRRTLDRISLQWDEALERLRAHVEDG